MSVASGCGEQEVGVASGRGWNLCVVVRRYIYISSYYLSLILLYLFFFLAASLLFMFNNYSMLPGSVEILSSTI